MILAVEEIRRGALVRRPQETNLRALLVRLLPDLDEEVHVRDERGVGEQVQQEERRQNV